MKIIYVTLNNIEEARSIAKKLLEEKLANCVNYFPITCMYNYKDKVTEEPEVVLIIKTKTGYYQKIKKSIKRQINYDNFIGQFAIDKVNEDFKSWLDEVVK